MVNDGNDKSDLPYESFGDTATSSVQGTARRRLIDIASGRGDASQALTDSFMGFNHRIAPTLIPLNRERSGLVFFTRPDLNLSMDNLNESRRMKRMTESDYRSADIAILGMLDPLCPSAMAHGSPKKLGVPFHPDVPMDNRQAFIPILTNRLISLTGFPDNTLDVYTSEEGLKREQYSFANSTYAANHSFTLSAAFRNMDGDITTKLMTTWIEAISHFYDGTFIPRMRNIIQDEICYQTRIYRLIMDHTNTYVTKIGIGAAAFPLNDNLGAIMNFDESETAVTANAVTNIQFQCDGAEYLDPILIEEFNEVVALFNPDMRPIDPESDEFIPYGKDEIRRLNKDEVVLFNHYGYPHIDRSTNELSWYVYSDFYEARLKELGL